MPDPIDTWLEGLPDQDLLALTLLAEARGEDRLGREMVASVIINRITYATAFQAEHGSSYYWGGTLHDVVLHPLAFSCFNRVNNPERTELQGLARHPLWSEAMAIAADALGGRLADATKDATAYLNPAACSHLPNWATPQRVTVQHLRHTFYRVV